MNKTWRIKPVAPAEYVSRFKQFHPLVAQLLYNRGVQNQEDAEKFFNPEYSKAYDPFLFRGMDKAVEKILTAIKTGGKIMIHGDYDADGVTSAAVLFKTLKILGADVDVFIPHRELDGYGINMANVPKFINGKTNLLITVDCGITNVNEISALMKGGVEVIITDHHEPLDIIPTAYAILDAKVKDGGYPFRDLAGAGVAFKLVQALLKSETIKEDKFLLCGGKIGFEKWLLDLVAIGTVADVAPLVDENRILVNWGLVVLKKTKNIGIKKLLESINTKRIDTYTIGYQLAPRLNAAGRMNHASSAFKLLVSENEEEAGQLVSELQKNNQDRQKITDSLMMEARSQIMEVEFKGMLFVSGAGWSPGIIGLIAGKLCDEFYRPIMVMTEFNGRIVGSGRSVEGFNITDTLSYASEMLARYGGHSQACGFTLNSVDALESFKVKIRERFEPTLKELDLTPCLDIEADLLLRSADWNLVNELQKFEPFGEINEKPIFSASKVQIAAYDMIGSDSRHLRLMVKSDSSRLYKMIWFSAPAEKLTNLEIGDTIDIAYELAVNEWNGNREIEFRVMDIKK